MDERWDRWDLGPEYEPDLEPEPEPGRRFLGLPPAARIAAIATLCAALIGGAAYAGSRVFAGSPKPAAAGTPVAEERAPSADPSPSTVPAPEVVPAQPESAVPTTSAPASRAPAPPAPRRTSAPAQPGPAGPRGEVLTLTNAERTKAGCPALVEDGRLANAAGAHSADMAAQKYFSHTSKDGSKLADRVNRAGYRWSALGENIAKGQQTPAAVVKAWMDSPGHRANILNCRYKNLGVGLAFDGRSPIWTQNFGSPLR